ncbi:MAG TPA: FG-GAP repeat protein [Phycisphaerae bacterium]|nr:FG-GAP repeat protein [Phycisphaerae bacterium]
MPNRIYTQTLAVLTGVVALNATGALTAAPAQHEVAELRAADGVTRDYFGRAVAISGDTVVIGAYLDDDNGTDSGSAYVFRFDGSKWVQQAKLWAFDGAPDDWFGYSVAVSGNVTVIGADRDNDLGSKSGSAYVFRFDGSKWVPEAKLLPADGAAGDHFGKSVAVSGDTIVIGVPFDDDKGTDCGAAYVYHYDGWGWVQQAKLRASDGAIDDLFGYIYSVAISGNTIVVGAQSDDDHGPASGSAYVFRYDGNAWVEQAKLTASDGAARDAFGFSVAVSGDIVVIGADRNDDNGPDSGSAYVFRYNASSWVEEAKLLASDGGPGHKFGYCVPISGNTVVIGAYLDDDKGAGSGSAYLYRFDGFSWVEEAKLLASDGAADDWFGYSVAVSGDTAVIGAFRHDDNGPDSGSAYIVKLTPACVGDIDGDGDTDGTDLEILLGDWGCPGGGHASDLDGDGDRDQGDLGVLLGDYGCGSSVR